MQYFEFPYFEIHYANHILQVKTKKLIPILYEFKSPEMARRMEAEVEVEAEAEAVSSFLRKQKRKVPHHCLKMSSSLSISLF